LGLTTLSLLIPAAFSATASGTTAEGNMEGIVNLSHGTAIVLLIVYGLYLFFQLKTHTQDVRYKIYKKRGGQQTV
jgi:Ca2+:H+ antiporter